MKLYFLSALLAIGYGIHAEEAAPPPVKAEEVRNIPTVGVIDLTNRLAEFQGKIIRLRFAFRESDPIRWQGTALFGILAEYGVPKGERLPTAMRADVEMPAEANGWYMSIPEDELNRIRRTVIVRVVGLRPGIYIERNTLRVIALGTETRSGFNGPEFLWPHVASGQVQK